MTSKIPCADQEGTNVCGKEHYSGLHGSKSSYYKAMYFQWKVGRRRCGGQGKHSRKGLTEEEACSMFALYLVPVCSPGFGKKGDALVLEEPGATDNLTSLARIMKLPNKLLSLMLGVLKDRQMNKETRMYRA